jgi:hypothetical protein
VTVAATRPHVAAKKKRPVVVYGVFVLIVLIAILVMLLR